MPQKEDADRFTEKEARHRFEAALRGARITGHKPMSELRVGKPKAKKRKSPMKRKRD